MSSTDLSNARETSVVQGVLISETHKNCRVFSEKCREICEYQEVPDNILIKLLLKDVCMNINKTRKRDSECCIQNT